MQTAFSRRPAGRTCPSMPRRRPHCTLGGGGLPRAPPPPTGVACSPAARGGARSGPAPLLGGQIAQGILLALHRRFYSLQGVRGTCAARTSPPSLRTMA
jgi:hypothetical protein